MIFAILQFALGCVAGGIAFAIFGIAFSLMCATPDTNSIAGIRLRNIDRARLRGERQEGGA